MNRGLQEKPLTAALQSFSAGETRGRKGAEAADPMELTLENSGLYWDNTGMVSRLC